ncbi:uncharacterized protein LOC126887256 [Diabrotica virgifera virgifera]|uniref:Ionotropic glutamate receptor C-terminal domain-containing protein n=1 Tax=Diabrotica virgifera virgifera TaxID=50390 RepID=A0ABM5KKA0_DIAVI|nr:uncharacterized protein LOC126887256 [Diabrotica virgifera virgifera]
MMIPKPQRIPFWKNNILVYQLPVWICIYTIIPVLSVIVFRYAHFRKNTDKKNFGSSVGNNIFFVLGLSLNVSANKIPKSWNLRVLLGFYLFFCLLELTYRQTKITSFSTISLHEKRVRNIEDLIDSDIPVKSFRSSAMVLPDNSPLLSKIEYLPDEPYENLTLRAAEERFATIWGEIGFVAHPFLYEVMDYFNLYMYQIGFYMPETHIFYEHFDLSMRKVIQRGFLEMLYGKYKHFFMLKYRHAYPSKDLSVKKDLKSCMFMFIVLFAGYCVSLLVFGIELLMAKRWNTLTKNRWFCKWFWKKK